MNKKVLIIIGLLVVLVLFVVFFSTQRLGRVKVVINSVPKGAQIIVNGDEMSTGTKYLKPGDYRIQAEKEGFAQTEQNYTLATKDSGIVVDLLLEPVTDEAIEWAKLNSKQYLEAEERGGLRALASGEEERKKYPILKRLPYKSTKGFTIGYRYDEKKVLLITIGGIGSLERQLALGQIESWGYKPSDYRLDFVDFVNPLETE